jgi:hypothetical protein
MSQRLLNAPTNRIISALTATAFVYQPLMSVLGRHIYILFLIQLASSDIEAASLEKRLRLFTYPTPPAVYSLYMRQTLDRGLAHRIGDLC